MAAGHSVKELYGTDFCASELLPHGAPVAARARRTQTIAWTHRGQRP
jgi:hypothetical protein